MTTTRRILAATEQAEADRVERQKQLSVATHRTLQVLEDRKERTHDEIAQQTKREKGNGLRLLDYFGLVDMLRRNGDQIVYRITARGEAVLKADGKLVATPPTPPAASGVIAIANHEQPPQVTVASHVATASDMLPSDLTAILRQETEPTTKEALVNARVGQGQFRSHVLQQWGNRCCVTGSKTLEAIRASHIKPWRDSNNAERLDPNNGLPLIASLDALFDAGFITFDPSGKLLVSPRLNSAEQTIFGTESKTLCKQPTSQMEGYLAYHRNHVFRK